MTIKETMRKGMIKLKTSNVSEPNLKSRLIMQYVLNKPRQYLIVYDNQVLTLREEVNYFKAIKSVIAIHLFKRGRRRYWASRLLC